MPEQRSSSPLSSPGAGVDERIIGGAASSEMLPHDSEFIPTKERRWFWRILEPAARAAPQVELELHSAEAGHDDASRMWTMQVHPADKSDLRTAVEEHLQGGLPCHVSCRIRSLTGNYRWYQIYGESVGGGQRMLLGWLRDIDDLKQLEVRCGTLEERYHELFEGSSDVGFTTDLTGKFAEFNRAAERVTGYSPGEAQNHRLVELVLPEERPRLLQHTHAVLGGGESRQGEWTLLTRSGGKVPVELSLRLLFRSGRPYGLQGLARDISERKQHERALRELSVRLLKAQDDEQRRLARELHDATAQELAAISMNLGHLQGSEPGLSSTGVDILNESLALAQQCAKEVRTMSYLLHPPLLDELGLAAAIHWFCNGFSTRSGIAVRLDIPPEFDRLPSEIETALFRIIQESLTNIHRHSESPTARIRLRMREDQVFLSICDKGKGIGREQLRDFRSGVGGAGVGLPGMRERIRKLGGTFTLRSRPVGLTLLVCVPCKETI